MPAGDKTSAGSRQLFLPPRQWPFPLSDNFGWSFPAKDASNAGGSTEIAVDGRIKHAGSIFDFKRMGSRKNVVPDLNIRN